MEDRLRPLLKRLISQMGSDLHIKAGAIPRVRINGELKQLGQERFTAADIDDIAKAIMTNDQYIRLQAEKSLDFSYIYGDEQRFRANFFYQMDGLSAVFRLIPVDIQTLDDLKLPEVVKSFAEMQRGLVLVTGVTGSGKSTTLAALIDKINVEQRKHIISIEDPIEFIHKDKGCLVNQRAIGQDTHSFSDALRAALREDPDIILLGELRDLETIDIAMHAANTGHLVFATLHTLDAKETIDRIIGMFAKEEQNRIRTSLASVLEGVISQRLVPTNQGGRTAAIEVLKKTSRIEHLILENRDYEIPDALFEGKEIYGTQTFDQGLLDLLREGRITEKTTLEYASNPSDIKLKMEGIGKGAIVKETHKEDKPEVFDLKEDEETSTLI